MEVYNTETRAWCMYVWSANKG